MMNFRNLFKSITINGLILKNRLVMPAMHHGYTPDGFATARFNEYYWRRAEGGAGLIIVGGCVIDNYRGYSNIMSLESDDYILGYKEFTDGMHKRGAKVAVQLMHTGRYGRTKYITGDDAALAPSAVYSRYTGETPRAMTKDEITLVIKHWADAGLRAKKAGFDAVEVVGSAGYLISQFLSPVTNLREDEYGGSFENRCRFPLEVLSALRIAVGDDYPIFMRVSGNDFIKGGNTNEDCVAFCKMLDKAGIDMINVTGGWHETNIPQLPGDVPQGGYAYLAQGVKDAVSVPVMASNRFNNPVVAERTLALCQADLIGVGRTLIADPDWPIKVKEGRVEEIRRCTACNQGCLGRLFFDKPVECLVNGYAGREFLLQDTKLKPSKNILVIGAGPAGCEFAIRAAERGHKVTIWEMKDTIGGQLHLASTPPSKGEFQNLVHYFNAMLKKTGVKVVLNKEATIEGIEKENFHEVVVATGSIPSSISLPGDGNISVVTFSEILEGKEMAGRNVVVIGGSSVGCETAAYLAHEASLSKEQLYFMESQKSEGSEKISMMLNTSRRNIAIIDIAKIGSGFDPGCGWPVLKDLRRLGVKQYSFSKIAEVTNKGVFIESTNPKSKEVIKAELPCDTIVLAVGSKPNTSLFDTLSAGNISVHNIGDSGGIGNVLTAIRQACNLAMEF
ncbi:FAD-dependent oxidoreductase [Clostridium kluyveri]|uniref:oxidoreductase n=1 Tax=Clostridium kluyveri TaxID=1534 RepID=UPI002246B5F2|nr:FAD-dependent oxidoreductase [Clostridium kluyveri]UZQ51455.1 FAD-dependent oxidoreductase [Clostridium kluyveri]